MRILPPVEERLRREVRDARAKDPLITVSALAEILEKEFNRSFSRKYVAKLSDKVARQALIEADRTQIEQRMAFTRENYRMVRERLLKIVFWKPEYGLKQPWDTTVVEAARNLVMLDLALLKAEIETGMYKKPIEALAKEIHYEPLPPEVRMVIIAAWERGGLLPRAAIEQMVPQDSTE